MSRTSFTLPGSYWCRTGSIVTHAHAHVQSFDCSSMGRVIDAEMPSFKPYVDCLLVSVNLYSTPVHPSKKDINIFPWCSTMSHFTNTLYFLRSTHTLKLRQEFFYECHHGRALNQCLKLETAQRRRIKWLSWQVGIPSPPTPFNDEHS